MNLLIKAWEWARSIPTRVKDWATSTFKRVSLVVERDPNYGDFYALALPATMVVFAIVEPVLIPLAVGVLFYSFWYFLTRSYEWAYSCILEDARFDILTLRGDYREYIFWKEV